MAIRTKRGSIIAGVLVASTVGLMVLVFSVFENAVGHGIAIASLAATTTVIVFQPHARTSQPKVVALSYTIAAAVGVFVGLLPQGFQFFEIVIGVVSVVVIFTALNIMHFPAVAYLFGFILGDYEFFEFFLTVMALGAFFVSLAVVVFLLEKIANLLSPSLETRKTLKSKSFFGKLELVVDRLVPYALILLFFSVLFQFLYPEILEPYTPYLGLLDWLIILLLVVDLFLKLKKAKNIKIFFISYWLEILAIMPFFLVLRTFQGVAISLEFLTRGAIAVPVGSQVFLRFLRPMARFPRFIRMLDNLDSLTGLTKK